jgi:hypothetical protein
MPFDPPIFEAELALNLIPTEQLPTVAQDALEAGFEGPHVIRMAILEPTALWTIDQALPPMLAELGCHSITPKEAALRLAHQRAKRILETGEDPLLSLSYFYRLMQSADYPEELIELGYLEDDCDFFLEENIDNQRELAHEAVENLLSPELRERRHAERKAAWEREQARAKQEWPYILNSPTGRTLLRERYKEKLIEMRPLLWMELVAWIVFGWAFSSWRTALIGYIVTVPVLFALLYWGEYRRMKAERRDLLLRRRVPEDQI